jgi:hypothetical protein
VLAAPVVGLQGPTSADQGHNTPATVTSSIILTNDRPVGSFSVAAETLASAPPILSLSIPKVMNPDKTPVEILVYFARSEKGSTQLEKVPISNFSLYPADHPAGFLMRASGAFHKLAATGPASATSEVRLVLEMKRIQEAKPWTRIAITVAPPQWRSENGR